MADPARGIRLRGVRVHNLKGVDLDLPYRRLIVFSGVSGSGKSSLAFDTLYAEGQRRYVETFSAYTRQFLDALDKPDADAIEGLPPALAVGQRVARRSARSTVGTVTEIHDHLALAYARLGRVECLRCGATVKPADPAAVSAAIEALPDRTRYLVAYPLEVLPTTDRDALADSLRSAGFVRVRADGVVATIDAGPVPMPADGIVDVVIDRLVRGLGDRSRRLDAIETAFARGLGRCRVVTDDQVLTFYEGWRCSRCGADAMAPEPRLLRFNSPLGACPACRGFGRVIEPDLARIVPDPSVTLAGGAIEPWTRPAYREWQAAMLAAAPAIGLPTDRPFASLTPEQVRGVVEGAPAIGFGGLKGFFARLEAKAYKVQVRVFLSRWRGEAPCPSCGGKRLRPEALAVKLGDLDLAELSALPIAEALGRVEAEADGEVSRRALGPALGRLGFLERIGLGYLTLDRPSRSLSGGESRRVALTAALGSGLVNTLYVLDEPSIGLHPRDVGRLVEALAALRDAGNTVVVVEHDEAVVRAADWLVDVGPGAGAAGGRIVYAGPPAGVEAVAESVTGAFLADRRRVEPSARRRPTDRGAIVLRGGSGHNLKNIDVTFPLGCLCVVTGVSGAGKSTLVEETLYPAVLRTLKGESLPAAPYRGLEGVEGLEEVTLIDQAPIGRSARSNPATYLKAFDEIRRAFAETHEAKLRNYGPGRFSFNVTGGRCEACEGNGYQTIDMQFLADVLVRCPECRGRRFRRETLEITYRGKTIAEVLDMTAREALAFFRHRKKVLARLRPLLEVGLDYLRLGQPASTLSGGEAQRLKLAAALAAPRPAATTGPRTLFLLDEPTTGLHPADVLVLLDALGSLADRGHSLVVVEHSPEVLARADWLIELGPGPGAEGGHLIAQGPPESVAALDTPTGLVLRERLGHPVAGGVIEPDRGRDGRKSKDA